MKEQRTVHVVGGFSTYEQMFVDHGWVPVDTVEDADLVQFCGGEDVWPGFYGQQVHPTTHFNLERDRYERKLYEMAVMQGKAIAGICRGAQFVHVMNGGRLFQDVDNHGIVGTHQAWVLYTDNDLLKLYPDGLWVSSTHHQMMDDNCGEIVLAAWRSDNKHTDQGLSTDGTDYCWDVEAVWHEDTRCFCYQPHPEYHPKRHECQRFYFQALKRFLFMEEREADMKEAS